MADKSENKNAPSDAAANAPNVPIKDPKVDVTVVPKRGVSGNDPYVKKIEKSVEKDVKRTLEGDAASPSKKALENVEKKVGEVSKDLNADKIEKVKVRVRGDAEGHPIKHDVEGKPPAKNTE
ncbi:MAG: hypothetical protein RLZZ324_556 [Candidatus Parcubacteria bacterium]|jgi:hypothetical protein